MWSCIACSLLFYTSFGQAVLYLTPNVQTAQALSATTLGLFDIFNGFFVARNQVRVPLTLSHLHMTAGLLGPAQRHRARPMACGATSIS